MWGASGTPTACIPTTDARPRDGDAYTHAATAWDVASFTYSYDLVGNRTSAEEYLGGAISRVGWTYDAASRLTSETRRDLDDVPQTSTRYTYDATGNRTTHMTDGLRTSYAYNLLDQLTGITGEAGTVTLTYDGRGNRTSAVGTLADGTTADAGYGYDALDRLTAVTLPEASLSYGYDADGRKVSATETLAAAQTTRYVWDELSQYGDVIAELDEAGTLTAAYTLAGGRIVAQTADGVRNGFVQDALGSTRAFTYDAYGSLQGMAAGETLATPYLLNCLTWTTHKAACL